MPDPHEGPDVSLEPPPQGDLSDSIGPLQSQEARLFPWQRIPSEAAKVQLAVQLNGATASTRVPRRSTNWARLGQSIWRANRTAFDDLFPVRDVPSWLAENFLPGALEEPDDEPMPLHFGIELKPPAFRTGPRVCVNAGAEESAIHDPLGTPLLQFPIAVVAASSRQTWATAQLPVVQYNDAVLPFRAPVKQTLAVFSLTGGTGRTSLAAGLARLLAGTGLRVMLADTSSYSLLPRLFGSPESRQGVIRNFFPAMGERNRMISLISLAVEPFAGDDDEQYRILQELNDHAAHMDRIVWDLSGAPLDWAAKVLGTSPQILVPLLPSAQSLMQLRATERFLNRCHDEEPSAHLRYVLNHFDEHDPLHSEMRDRFQQQLGSKLLRVSMRRSPLVDEALSFGRTVIDHAPQSPLVDDLWKLAQQLHQIDETADARASTPSDWFER